LTGIKKHIESVHEQLVEKLTQQTAQTEFALSKTDDKLVVHEQVTESNVNKFDSMNTEVRLIKGAVKETSLR
jgi:hypothetical protein